MRWDLFYAPEAARRIRKLDPSIRERFQKALANLVQHPDAGKLLTGPLTGRRSLRVGDWRILYRPEREKGRLAILTLGHRREIHR